MKPLPLESQPLGEAGVRSVRQVATARVAQRGEMHPNLVCPPRFEVHIQQTCRLKCLDSVVMRDACLTVGGHGKTPVVPVVPPDRSVDRSAARVRVPA